MYDYNLVSMFSSALFLYISFSTTMAADKEINLEQELELEESWVIVWRREFRKAARVIFLLVIQVLRFQFNMVLKSNHIKIVDYQLRKQQDLQHIGTVQCELSI
ncbi:uncharacterized protein LOC113300439 [Papaver somniferum]|uniref:uncharacterized protein LOC113300439 n=1 Tax=Papaver somniferum TaxID=3469 RepID=UPI000E6FB24E|nr:uncharacterized protein LOC113300439 [Papaver somniferum]